MRRAEQAKSSGKASRARMGALPGCYERALKKMPPEVARALV